MTETIWHRETCGPGRDYMLGHQPQVRYENRDAIIKLILDEITQYLLVEPAIRLVLDSPKANAERVILSIPAHSDSSLIMLNFATEIYNALQGYYLSADPRSSHFGISELVFDGKMNNFVKREMERIFEQIRIRPDIAGRVLKGVHLEPEKPVPAAGINYLSDTIKKALNIYVGYRFHAHGEGVNHTQIFLPLASGTDIVELVYYNLEQVLNQNFLAYDEAGDSYLKITETLVYKELESVIQRAKLKENTRKKITNNIQFNLLFSDDPRSEFGAQVGDALYDMINKVADEKVKEATRLSSELYATVSLKNQEIVAMNQPVISGRLKEGIKVPAKKEKAPKDKDKDTEKVPVP